MLPQNKQFISCELKKNQSWQIEVGLHYISIDETCGLPWTMNEANAANRLKRVPYVQNLNRYAVTFFLYDFGHLKKRSTNSSNTCSSLSINACYNNFHSHEGIIHVYL